MNPKQKLESALSAYVISLLASDLTSFAKSRVYKGIENTLPINADDALDSQPQTKQLPCIRVEADGDFAEAIPFTGDWEGHAIVSVEADAQNTTDEQFDTLSRQVFSVFDDNELKQNLTDALDDFTCLFVELESFSSTITDGGNWHSFIRLRVVFCETDL